MPIDHLLHGFLRGDLKDSRFAVDHSKNLTSLLLQSSLRWQSSYVPLASRGPQFLSATGSMREITLFCSSDDTLQVKSR